MSTELSHDSGYQYLLGRISTVYSAGQLRALTLRHGKGFSRSDLVCMRLLYLHYPNGQKPSDLLSWSHHVELLRIDNPLERSFYEQQAIREKWSVPELQRQKRTSRSTITGRLKNIFESEELDETAVCRDFRHTAEDGKYYTTRFYN